MGEQLGAYRNVFDDQNEFNKLHDLILNGVQEFSVYRKGNLTYGEIMFVMECILDNMRGSSEKEARGNTIAGLASPTFTTLLSISSRLVETMVKKGVISSAEEAYILHGDK
ncbi:MAG: hypothetical protein LBB56_07530 [Chitinispirillales bacterium]|jgi:hypothetical protein|nr:hypothetical protein [Chitinispirillales bacterium]